MTSKRNVQVAQSSKVAPSERQVSQRDIDDLLKELGPLVKEGAYAYDGTYRNQTERTLRCAAYLLEALTQAGNDDADGIAVWGIAQLLKGVADDTRHLFDAEDVVRLGGDPYTPMLKSDTSLLSQTKRQ